MTLDELFIKYGSDKATVHANAHGYAPHYESVFAPIRYEPVKLLEIGVGSGASIQAWLDYFQKANVFGVDTSHDTNPWDTADPSADPRYKFVPGNQASQEFWDKFVVDCGPGWDIIVDDGGHYADQVITSFNCLWPHLKSGGTYCIEDLNVSYPDLWEKYGDSFVKPPWASQMEFIKNKLDEINRGVEIESLHFSKELAIIKKTNRV